MLLTDEECLECGLVLPPSSRLRWAVVVANGQHAKLLKLAEQKVRNKYDDDTDYVYYSTLDLLVETLTGEGNRAPSLTNALIAMVEKKV